MTSRRRSAAVLAFAAVALVAAELGGPPPEVVPQGPEFPLVGGDTSFNPRVAVDEQGTFLALFHNVFSGFADLRGGIGDLLMPPFAIGGGTRGVDLDSSGLTEFVVSWTQTTYPLVGPPEYDVQLARYLVDGTKIVAPTVVSDVPASHITALTAVGARDDDFLVVWEADQLRLRSIPRSGPPAASVPLNSWTTGSSGFPRIAVADDGSALVAWRTTDCAPLDDSGGCIRGRKIDPGGVPTGPDFQINTITAGVQGAPVVAARGSTFVVAWNNTECPGECIRARMIDPAPLGGGDDFRVDEPGAAAVGEPGIAANEHGFIVSWRRFGGSAAQDGISRAFARAFNASGVAFGGEFEVNTAATSESYQTDAGINADGTFVVVWSNAYDLWGRRFVFDPSIFEDGFESGDTGAWSVTVD